MSNNANPMVRSMAEAASFMKSHPKTVFFGSEKYFYAVPGLRDLKMSSPFVTHLGFTFQKNSELLPLFNYHLLKMLESGTIDKISRKWKENDKPDGSRDVTAESSQQEALVLGYDNLLFPFLIIFAGVGLAFLFSIGEWARKRIPRLVQQK